MKFQSALLNKIPNIQHGFYTRNGGVSDGIYKSLNCGMGSDDNLDHVLENRTRVARDMGLDETANLLTVYQVHGTDCLSVRNPVFDFKTPPKADAMITDETGIALGILTADCAPVLFASNDGKMVAAAHAGWRGALSGILTKSTEKFAVAGYMPEEIYAAIGPCIAQESYEVDMSFLSQFLLQSPANEQFFLPSERAEHFMFDLGGYIVQQLKIMGLTHVDFLAMDTYKCEQDFFSFRRKTHRNEPNYGRQISAITITT